jgi:dihydroxyacetone kinase-like predicted kinase
VHTDIPGSALSESQKYGALDLAKIENMRLQALDQLAGQKAKSTDDLEEVDAELSAMESGEAAAEEEESGVAEPEKDFGVVAVCAGKGMEELFLELGADAIVTGGQTMNPSTDDILRAVNRTPASTVFVFPNNKNIIMAAEQCVPLTEKHVVVMPTKTVPQGISAMLNFSPDESEESLVGAMGEAIGNVHTAMVTYAARDSDFDGHSIHAGEYLALLDGSLIGSYTNTRTLFKELSWAVDDFHPEFITVYYGEDVTGEEAETAAETIRGNFPDAEVSVVSGGQPVYYYMISVE